MQYRLRPRRHLLGVGDRPLDRRGLPVSVQPRHQSRLQLRLLRRWLARQRQYRRFLLPEPRMGIVTVGVMRWLPVRSLDWQTRRSIAAERSPLVSPTVATSGCVMRSLAAAETIDSAILPVEVSRQGADPDVNGVSTKLSGTHTRLQRHPGLGLRSRRWALATQPN